MEALKQSTCLAWRADLPPIKGESRRNTLCISRFSQRRAAENPPSRRARGSLLRFRMKTVRRILSLLLLLALLLSASARAVGDALLAPTQRYDGRFDDVPVDSWYYPSVVAGFEYGLFTGRGARSFAPDAPITVAELATLSARIRAARLGDAVADTTPWSVAPYVAYLRAQGAFDERLAPELNARATRAQMAAVFAATLPEDCFDNRNARLVTDAWESGAFIRDVDGDTPCQPQILWMYRQGLLTGTDASGSFQPGQPTTRAEVAAVVTRLVDPALRLTPDWVVLPRWSAVGTTLTDLVPMPEQVDAAPAYDDADAIDALVRRMLALGERSITLNYPAALGKSDLQTIANRFNDCVKNYCEQMYNHAYATLYSKKGHVTVDFSALGCTDEELTRYREETMACAVAVHDELWETGQLSEDMSQLEIARVYFLWLCDHCAYDYGVGVNDESLSHIAYGALADGKAVCDGYVGAYNLFLKLEGIDCRAVHNESHIWTAATLDGTAYHIDVTWADQSGRTNMAYFAMTPEQSYTYHPWSFRRQTLRVCRREERQPAGFRACGREILRGLAAICGTSQVL